MFEGTKNLGDTQKKAHKFYICELFYLFYCLFMPLLPGISLPP